MPLSREERKLLHQKAKQPTFGVGKPPSSEGKDGDIAFRKVEGSGTVEYVKENGSWTAVASSGQMPPVRIVGGSGSSITTIESSSSTSGNHSSLAGLTDDDHTQYVLADGTRAFSGNWTNASRTVADLGTITTVDINGGTIDGATIATSNITVGSSKTLDVSAGTLTLANNQISGDKVEGGTINATTITGLTTAGITATANIDIGAYDFRANTIIADDLTSGRVVFSRTNGQLTDDNDFTFATDTLTVTKIGAYELTGKLTAGSVEIEGSAFDINGGDISAVTISGGLTWSSAQDLNSQALTNANIDSGAIDGTPIGANSANTGAFTTITASTSIDITGATGLILSNDETITNATNGQVDINGNLQIGSGSGDVTLKSSGNHNLTLQTGNSTTGSITITDGANGNIAITPNGTGYVPIGSSVAAGIMGSILSSSTISALETFHDQEDAESTHFNFEPSSGNLLVTNGFTASNASFDSDTNKAKLINTSSANGYVSLPLVTVANEIYEVVFDVITGGNSDIEVCLSSSTTWNVGSESGAVGEGTNYGLIKNYKADDTSSYLIIRLVSATNTQWSYITNIYVRKAVVFTGGEIGSASFVSGFAGSGWKIDKDATGDNEYDITVDNMFIRGRLSVYELLIQQIRATNGAVFVTSAAKVASTNITSLTGGGNITFEDPSGHGICPFHANDIIMMQRVVPGSLAAGNAVAPVGDVIKKLVYQVSSVSGATAAVAATSGYTNANLPVAGDDFVRIGNIDPSGAGSSRQGSIYLTSDDSNAPFIDIKDNIDSYADWHSTATTKVRLGKLDGITDTDAGLDGSQSNSYGLYSSDVFLKGHIKASTGDIGGWNIVSNNLYNLASGTPTSSPNNGIVISTNLGITNNKPVVNVYDGTTINAALGNFANNKYGIYAIEGDIGGWAIDSNSISKNASGSYIGIASTANASSPTGNTDPQFFAGATGTQGQSANIAFASNGKIYGNGIYVKNSVDYLITASRLFGNGSDGNLTIDSSSLTTDENNSGDDLGSNWISSGALQRDIYAANLTISASVTVESNGYRIFVRDTLTIGGSGVVIQNSGFSGANGGNGSGSTGGLRGTSTGTGANTGEGGRVGSLYGGPRGGRGGTGGDGASGGDDATAGGAGTSSSQTYVVKNYSNSAGARGADGSAPGSGSTAGSSNGSAASATEGVLSFTNADLTYIIAMKDMFALGTTAPSLYPAVASVGGGGGGGGHGESGNGAGGGGGGQGGGAGGHVMIIAKFISGTQSNLTVKANGGTGGDGGDDGTGNNGGVGAGGNGGDGGCVTIISGTDPDGITVQVNAGSAGSNGSTGNTNNVGTPAGGQTGTTLIIHC